MVPLPPSSPATRWNLKPGSDPDSAASSAELQTPRDADFQLNASQSRQRDSGKKPLCERLMGEPGIGLGWSHSRLGTQEVPPERATWVGVTSRGGVSLGDKGPPGKECRSQKGCPGGRGGEAPGRGGQKARSTDQGRGCSRLVGQSPL